MAVQRANSPAVKQFAQRMIQDHTQASRDLAPLAARKGVRLPTALNNQNRTRMTQLANLSGTQFDQAYMSEMINSHAQDATLFQTEAQQGRDQDLRAYAAKYLPIIQGHLQMARSMVQPRT
jgi:putative membrane protein